MPSADRPSNTGNHRNPTETTTLADAVETLKFPFGSEYQKKLLAIFLRRRDFLPIYGHLMRPGHFGSPIMRDTALLILDLFKKYGVAPSIESLREEIDRDLKRRGGRLPRGVADEWRIFVEDLDRIGLSDAKIIKEQVVRWVQERVFEQSIVQLGAIRDRMVETGEFDMAHAKKIIMDASHVGMDTQSVRFDYFGNIDRRVRRLLLDDGQYGLRVPLLLSELDNLLEGGPKRKEMVVWAAPTGRGKTHAMVWATKAAVYQAKKVAFFTAEMTGSAIEGRVDRAIANMTPHEMRDDPELLRRRIENAERYQGQLLIFDIGGKNPTVDHIQSCLELELAQTGFIPDVILVDYPGVMRPRQKFNERRHGWAEIYTDLHALAKEWDAVLHVPIQTNKGSLSRMTITERDFAECFEIAWHADLILSLCQTSDEELDGLMRIYIAKNREGQGQFVAPFFFNKATGNFLRAGEAKKGPRLKIEEEEASVQNQPAAATR
jgi:hypothetical protein